MDERHNNWDRCAPSVRGTLAFFVPFALLVKYGAHIVNIVWLFGGTSGQDKHRH